jgi:UDP-N-acetylmuramoyl-tripeptide--D-alanyl-D-alanine ligase
MKLSDVATALKLTLPTEDAICQGVSIDSRTAPEGSLYVAIKGENHDGHQYVSQLESRCVAAIVNRKVETNLPCFQVADTLQAMTTLARYWRDQITPSVVAITGSCGKTTTRELLRSILAQFSSVMASKKSQNNAIGVPLTLLQATREHKHLVLEVGTSFPGEIALHSHLVRPSIAVILNATTAHLAGLVSLEGVVQEKGDLLLGLQKNGVAILNRDDPYFSVWEKRVLPSQKIVSVGLDLQANVRGEDLVVEADGTLSFTLSAKGVSKRLHLPLLGRHNVLNALAAIAVALELGIGMELIQAGLTAGSFEPRRLEVKLIREGVTLIDDTYNANPKSMQAAIELLAEMPNFKKILVVGDMLELGDQSIEFHRRVGEQAKALGISMLYGYGSFSQETVVAFGKRGTHWQDLAELSTHLQEELTAGTVVLVKGSNSMGMDQVVRALTESTEEA